MMPINRLSPRQKILLCVYFFYIGYGLALTSSLPSLFYRSLQLIAIILLLYYVLLTPLKMTYIGFGKICFVLYMFCSLICFIRGVDEITYRDFLYTSEIYALVMPIFGLYFFDIMHYRDLKYISVIGVWIAFAFCIFNFKTYYVDFMDAYLEVVALGGYDHKIINRCGVPAFFIMPFLMTSLLYDYKKIFRYFAYFIAILAFLALFLMGRRSGSAELIAYIAIYLMFRLNKSNRILLLILVLVILFIYIIPIYIGGNTDLVFFQRLAMDTRSGVEIDFIKDFNKNGGWLFGRGISGTYYCPSLLGLDQLHRSSIETGYLNFILKGGMFFLVSYVGILLYCFYLGFFKSKNKYCKYVACIILFNILMLYPNGFPVLSPSIIFLFSLIPLCQNNKIRQMPDEIFIKKIN